MNEYEEYVPPARKKNRRTRLKDALPDWKVERNERSRKSKPKGFKPKRGKNEFS